MRQRHEPRSTEDVNGPTRDQLLGPGRPADPYAWVLVELTQTVQEGWRMIRDTTRGEYYGH